MATAVVHVQFFSKISSFTEQAFVSFIHSVKTLLTIHPWVPERYETPGTSLFAPQMGYEQASFSKIIMGGWILTLGLPVIRRTIVISCPPDTTSQYFKFSSPNNTSFFPLSLLSTKGVLSMLCTASMFNSPESNYRLIFTKNNVNPFSISIIFLAYTCSFPVLYKPKMLYHYWNDCTHEALLFQEGGSWTTT